MKVIGWQNVFSYSRSALSPTGSVCRVRSHFHLSWLGDCAANFIVAAGPDKRHCLGRRRSRAVWRSVGFGKQISGYPWAQDMYNYASYDRVRARSGWCCIEACCNCLLYTWYGGISTELCYPYSASCKVCVCQVPEEPRKIFCLHICLV